MNYTQQLVIWSTPIVLGSFAGAAQFSAASDSQIVLASRIPNIFGHDGDYVEFEVFQGSASSWTLLGSTFGPDAILINDNTITITDGTDSDSITLLASISTTAWTRIKLVRNGSTIECYINGVLELQTLDVISLSLDIIGKNSAAFGDVYALELHSDERQFLSIASPSSTFQGATEHYKQLAFKINSVGDHTLIDNLSGNDGFRLEVVNVYLSAHRVKWTVGNGTTTTVKLSDDVFYVGQDVIVHCDLESLESDPEDGTTVFDGNYSPNSGAAYIGAEGGTSNFADATIYYLHGGDSRPDSSAITFSVNGGLGRAYDEYSGEITFGNYYKFSESSGTRADTVGSDDFTENSGELIGPSLNNGGFETTTASWFEDWTRESGDIAWSQETSTVNGGTYSAKAVVPGSGNTSNRILPTGTLKAGQTYDISLYVAASSLASSPTFRIQNASNAEIDTFTLSSTSFTQYTTQYTPNSDTTLKMRPWSNHLNKTFYVDDVLVAPSKIARVLGLRTSYLNAADFTGYLRKVKFMSGDNYVNLPLYTNANDVGGDANHGTATSVTWATEDPAA